MTIKPVPPVFPDNLPIVPEKPRPEHPIAPEPPKLVRPEPFAVDDAEKDLGKLEEKTLKEFTKILEQHNYQESNIGVGDNERYWELKNQYRALLARDGRIPLVATPKEEK